MCCGQHLCLIIHLQTRFIMEAIAMNPREQSDLGPYLQYRITKNINR